MARLCRRDLECMKKDELIDRLMAANRETYRQEKTLQELVAANKKLSESNLTLSNIAIPEVNNLQIKGLQNAVMQLSLKLERYISPITVKDIQQILGMPLTDEEKEEIANDT